MNKQMKQLRKKGKVIWGLTGAETGRGVISADERAERWSEGKTGKEHYDEWWVVHVEMESINDDNWAFLQLLFVFFYCRVVDYNITIHYNNGLTITIMVKKKKKDDLVK